MGEVDREQEHGPAHERGMMKSITQACLTVTLFITTSVISGCVDEAPVGLEEQAVQMDLEPSQVQGDTIQCPPNPWRLRHCVKPSGQTLQLLFNQTDQFASPAACQAAKNAVQPLLDDDVYIALHPMPSGGMLWSDSDPPDEHEGQTLFLAEYLFSQPQVDEGNLRLVMYHESSHLLHYEDDEPSGEKMDADEFADMCKDAETDEIDNYDYNEISSGGGVDEPTTCVWRIWYYPSSGVIIRSEKLYCF